MAGTMYLQKFRMSKFDVFFSRVISAAENKQPRHRASGDSAQCFALQRDTINGIDTSVKIHRGTRGGTAVRVILNDQECMIFN